MVSLGECQVSASRLASRAHAPPSHLHSVVAQIDSPPLAILAPLPCSNPLRLVLVDPRNGGLEKHGSPSPWPQDGDDNPSLPPFLFACSYSFSNSFSLFQGPPSVLSWREEKSQPVSYFLESNPTAIRRGLTERRLHSGR
jgi:hypothetical protein